MAKFRRSKTNTTYFIDIPKPAKETPNEEILKLLKKKYDLKEQRTSLLVKIRGLRTELYNLSKTINKYEETIDKILLEKIIKE